MGGRVLEELCHEAKKCMNKMATHRVIFYNSSYHISIKMSQFMVLYVYDTPKFVDMLLSDSRVPKARDFMQENQNIMKALNENIQVYQNQ